MDIIHECAVKLVRYVLTGDKPELPLDIDFRALLKFSEDHGISNMVYAALAETNTDVPSDIMELFEDDYEMQVVLEANQAYEFEILSSAFEESGIDHMPLKGSVIKYIYPLPDYRHSGDIDILIHPEDLDNIRSIMAKLGYRSKDAYEGHDIHLVYDKLSMVSVEIHRQLVNNNNRSFEFCRHVWERASVNAGTKHCFSMNNECLYTYMMAHLAKHLYSGGAGIRLITDIWLMKKHYTFDEKRLERYLDEANLTELDKMITALAGRWYDGESADDKNTDTLEEIVLTGGSFGSHETKLLINGNDSIKNKLHNFFEMIFPSARALSGHYPIIRGRKYLYPFVWIYRCFALAFSRRQRVQGKLRDNFCTKDKNTDIRMIINAVKNIRTQD